MKYRSIIIDDDPRSIEALKLEIAPLHHHVATAFDQASAYQILRNSSFDYALVDIRLKANSRDMSPDAEVGYATIEYIREHFPNMVIIAETAYDSKSEVNTNAIKSGADDFWSKNPGRSGEKLMSKIRRLLGNKSDNHIDSTDNAVQDRNMVSSRISTGKPIPEVEAEVKRLSRTDATVLFLGEKGTGKGFYAEKMHYQSKKENAPFKAINCSSLTKEMIVSELFGHTAGSFSGAEGKRKGLVSAAAGGTLFLDEIGDLPLDCQAVILRFVEQKEIKSLGSDSSETIDVRLLAATNQDLELKAKQNTFRSDLYSRLSGFKIVLPPLRDRGKEEFVKLSKHFSRKFKTTHRDDRGYKDIRVQNEAWNQLASYEYPWPGNVRELEQVINATFMLIGGKNIRFGDFISQIERISIIPHEEDIRTVQAIPDKLPEITEREKIILKQIKIFGYVQKSQVQEILGIRSTAAWNLLKQMIGKGLIQSEGRGRSVSYINI